MSIATGIFIGRWPGCVRVTLALSVMALLVLAGCSHETEPSKPTEEAVTNTVAPGPVKGSPENELDYPDVTAEAAVADLEKVRKETPLASFARYEIQTVQFPDKTPMLRRRIKIFSDGSTKNDGDYTQWYPNGQIYIKGQYVEGRLDGTWTIWHDNKNLCKEEHYKDGLLDGKWTASREDGSKERDVGYHKGLRDGLWVNYDATGKIPLDQEEYKEGKPDGAWIKWFASGKKQFEMHFKEGRREGPHTVWFENGQKSLVENFVDNQLEGKQIRWKENGDKISELDFEKGQQVHKSQTASAK